MKYLYFIPLLFLTAPGFAQPAPQYTIQYDPSGLRVPGASFSIGIVTRTGTDSATRTKGWLNGKNAWSKYRLDVDSGSFSNGKIRLKPSVKYKKGDSITVSVYTRKWLLGGKGKELLTQKIPYDYEDSISILTTGNIGRAPGDHVQFGVRTWFDNKQFADTWFPAKKKKAQGFQFDFDGGHLSKKKGDLKIDTDPKKISHDQVRLIASLIRQPAISDTLRLMLDYIANYSCKIQSRGQGHDLYVNADVYFDSLIDAHLIKVRVTDSTTHKIYRYKINTNGGSLTISSKGANGSDGRNGLDGQAGLSGSDGTISTDVETTTASDGTTQTTVNTTQGPGGNGSPGSDGDNGDDGDNGSNGGNIFVSYSPTTAPFLSLIKALSIPGAGGSGGRGGRGGSGGSGGNGSPSGMSGSNGLDGRSGSDGASGSPGKVIFTLHN
jgi:hypothetical protein